MQVCIPVFDSTSVDYTGAPGPEAAVVLTVYPGFGNQHLHRYKSAIDIPGATHSETALVFPHTRLWIRMDSELQHIDQFAVDIARAASAQIAVDNAAPLPA